MNRVQSHFDFAPSNSIRIRRNFKSLQKPRHNFSQTLAQTIHQRRHSEFHIRHTWRPSRFKLENDSIYAPHSALEAVLALFVETISNQIHQLPPKLSSV